MDPLQKVEGHIELKCHADKFFDFWAHKLYLVPGMCPDKICNYELHEGEWGKVGAVISGNYIVSAIGENAFIKMRVEELDEETRSVTYRYDEGYILENYYSSLRSKIEIAPNGENCIVKWSMEYEKKKEDAPAPNVYNDFLLGLAKDIDACLCNA